MNQQQQMRKCANAPRSMQLPSAGRQPILRRSLLQSRNRDNVQQGEMPVRSSRMS
jgi:hypothetical protein